MDHYEHWDTYLSKGRDKNSRPLGNSRTKRVLRNGDGSIALHLHYTDVVTVYPDGSQVIDTGGWRTVSTVRFLNEYSSARVYSEKSQLYVRTSSPSITAPRVTKCRTCHGKGGHPNICPGHRWCYEGQRGYDYPWGSQPDQPCQHGHLDSHRLPCDHEMTSEHVFGTYQCWRCKGAGRADYGSKPIHYAWDGSRLLISADGEPVGPVGYVYVPPVPKPATSKSAPKKADYSDSGALLETVLPALEQTVACPACGNSDDPVCSSGECLEWIIIGLNDRHKWTREQIADWLESLDIDLTFPVPDEIPAHIH